MHRFLTFLFDIMVVLKWHFNVAFLIVVFQFQYSWEMSTLLIFWQGYKIQLWPIPSIFEVWLNWCKSFSFETLRDIMILFGSHLIQINVAFHMVLTFKTMARYWHSSICDSITLLELQIIIALLGLFFAPLDPKYITFQIHHCITLEGEIYSILIIQGYHISTNWISVWSYYVEISWCCCRVNVHIWAIIWAHLLNIIELANIHSH